MRIAVVCPYDVAAPGGVQQICIELVERLQSSGEGAELIGPGESALGGRIRRMSANRSTVPISLDPRMGRKVRQALDGFDIVHIHEPFIPMVGWAALAAGAATVVTFHADPARWTKALYRFGAAVGRRALRGAELTAVSPVALAALPASWRPIELIPNAIDVAAYDVAVDRDPNRVVFLGRDDPRKGLDVLLEAWPSVRGHHPDAELVVVGARRSDPVEGVEFLGRVDEADKRKALASAGIHVAPNRGGESFGIVVAEGMAAGCAVVASDLPAFSHVLGADGLLVPAGDTSVLAREIVGLLSDPTRSTALGDRARRSAARFDWSEVVGRYRMAYESALRRHRSTIRGRKE